MYQCEVTFEGLERLGVLNSQELMHNLFSRLPHHVKTQFVSASTSGENGESSFRALQTLVERAADEAESEYGRLLYKPKAVPAVHSVKSREPQGKRVCVAQQSLASPCAQSPVFNCCGGPHKL